MQSRMQPRTIANATNLPITIENVYEAEARIRDEIHYTPVFTNTYLNNLSKYSLHFKCENLQKTGSFKVIWGYTTYSHITHWSYMT